MDKNVRYEDDFEKEDDANNKRTHDEQDANDKIKMSEVQDPIATNDEAGFESTRPGTNGTTVGEQDISPVSRSRQLRAVGIEDSPPAKTLPSAAGTNINQLATPEKTLRGSNSNESTPPGKILKKVEDTSSQRLFNNGHDMPLDMEANMPGYISQPLSYKYCY